MDPVRAERRSVSATVEVPVPAARVFDVLASIDRHAEIDGSGMLQGEPIGPTRLALGAEFTMGMQQVDKPYRSFSRVVEFEEGRRITWESMGTWRGRQTVGGQRWRWVLTPIEGGTLVQHSYVWGYARLALLTVWLPLYPRRARSSLQRSLANLARIMSPGTPPT
jgi:uncharacterized protein YndB with AHSA1/START domain